MDQAKVIVKQSPLAKVDLKRPDHKFDRSDLNIAQIKKGDVILDLDSPDNLSCIDASKRTGKTGQVIKIEFLDALANTTEQGTQTTTIKNLEFRQSAKGGIPVTSNVADVVFSNNISTFISQKSKILKEIYRVLKPGGKFIYLDVLTIDSLPSSIRRTATKYGDHLPVSIQKELYSKTLRMQGFENVQFLNERELSEHERPLMDHMKMDIQSFPCIMVYAEKSNYSPCDHPGCC